MRTLLLRLAAPMQAWGTESKFDIRQSEREPTKSGIIGLLAAALGRKREDDLSDLNKLILGIRIDREGKLLKDFHMVQENLKKPYLTYRYYLSDAVFLVGLESEDTAFLNELEEALRYPVFPLFLGRRSCPPTLPLVLGIRDTDLLTALREEPSLVETYSEIHSNTNSMRMITDMLPGETEGALVKDVPISFSQNHRRYQYRKVVERGFTDNKEKTEIEHDPMNELR